MKLACLSAFAVKSNLGVNLFFTAETQRRKVTAMVELGLRGT